MSDLYALLQVIKKHPLTPLYADDVRLLLRHLRACNEFNASSLMRGILALNAPYAEGLQAQTQLFDVAYGEALHWQAAGCQWVSYGDFLFPSSCYQMEDPPWGFHFRGHPCWVQAKSLSVVGSREASYETLQWMEKELAVFMEAEGTVIVSGGARGVDQRAHALALRKGLPTVVVLPSGLGEVYPSSLQSWIADIEKVGGCLLSEYPHSQKMHKHLFHHRNRLIAALSPVTLLVEARRRSGTLITAQQALQMGRPLWVVPGHPLDSHFLGSLDLLNEGATMVRDCQDMSLFYKGELSEAQRQAGSLGKNAMV